MSTSNLVIKKLRSNETSLSSFTCFLLFISKHIISIIAYINQ